MFFASHSFCVTLLRCVVHQSLSYAIVNPISRPPDISLPAPPLPLRLTSFVCLYFCLFVCLFKQTVWKKHETEYSISFLLFFLNQETTKQLGGLRHPN